MSLECCLCKMYVPAFFQDNVNILEPEMMTDVMCLAEKCKDYKLLASVQNFISCNI